MNEKDKCTDQRNIVVCDELDKPSTVVNKNIDIFCIQIIVLELRYSWTVPVWLSNFICKFVEYLVYWSAFKVYILVQILSEYLNVKFLLRHLITQPLIIGLV